jgi:hypothetical protein
MKKAIFIFMALAAFVVSNAQTSRLSAKQGYFSDSIYVNGKWYKTLMQFSDSAIYQKKLSAGTDIAISGNTVYNTSGFNSVTGRDSSTSHFLTINTATSTLNLTPALTIRADMPIEVHSNYANGAVFYTHANAGFRAPYINFNRSRGTENAPTRVQNDGYELSSLGGITWNGYDGVQYPPEAGPSILTQIDQTWVPGKHGSHLSIYYNPVDATDAIQGLQIGGVDPVGLNDSTIRGLYSNIISYMPITFGGNRIANPGIFPTLRSLPTDTASISIKSGDTSILVNLKAGYIYSHGVRVPTFSDLSTYVPTTRTLNGLALLSNQTFATGTSGTDFNISSSGTTHTFNIPDASTTARGLITTGTQTISGTKTFIATAATTHDFKLAGGASGAVVAIGNVSSGIFGTVGFNPGALEYQVFAVGGVNLILGAGGSEKWRINTSGNLSNTGSTGTAFIDLKAGTTSASQIRLRAGVAPSSPNDGDIWYDGTDLKIRVGSTTYTLQKL